MLSKVFRHGVGLVNVVVLYTAVILAGGVGSRLYPLTRVIPKPLIPFAGAPLLDYTLKSLAESGINEVIITARYLGEYILRYYRGHSVARPVLLDSKDTADAVRLIAGLIKGDFMVLMGDTATNISYTSVYKYHVESQATGTIVLKEVDNPLPYGLVYVDKNSNILLFSEKPPSLEIYFTTLAFQSIKGPVLYGNLVNTGVYVFRDEILDILVHNPGLMDFGRHVFPYLLENGYVLKAWIAPTSTYWNDIGRPEVYKEALWDLIDGRISGWTPPGRNISRGVYIQGEPVISGLLNPPVFIGNDVTIEPGAIVGPYAVVENGSVIRAGSKISYSIVWSGGEIGRNTIVHDSIVMNNAVIHDGVKIVSSIIGTGCNIKVDMYKQSLEPCIMVPPYENLR